MVITYQGENYFKIQSGNFSILIDPVNARSLRGANLILNTLKPAAVENESDAVWIDNEGEYEVEGVRILGLHTEYEKETEKTAYVFTLEDIRVGVLGHLTKETSPGLLEKIGETDILILPGGGNPFIGENLAAKIIRQFEPSVIIPSLFKDSPKKLMSELSQNPAPEEKFVVKKKDLSANSMKFVYLRP